MRSRGWVTVAAAAAVLVGPAVATSAATAAPSSPEAAARKVDPAVVQDLAAGPVEALVTYAAPPPSTLTDPDVRGREYAQVKKGALSRSAGKVAVVRDMSSMPIQLVRFDSEGDLDAFAADPSVASVTQNRFVQSGAASTENVSAVKPSVAATKSTVPSNLSLIRQPEAFSLGPDGYGASVALLDTGLDYKKAFGCRAAGEPGCPVVYAADVAKDDGKLDQSENHGTVDAAIVAQVAPKVKLIGLDVFTWDKAAGVDGFNDADVISGLNWVAEHQQQYGIRAVNLSFGYFDGRWDGACAEDHGYTAAFSVVRAAGVVPVVAAGNRAYVNGQYVSGLSTPACTPGAVAVSAVYDSGVGTQSWMDKPNKCKDVTTRPDQIACFAQGGPNVSVFAPGVYIRAGATTLSGTSQAAPHVAGAIAALASVRWGAREDQLAQAVSSSNTLITDRRGSQVNVAPRLDMVAAIEKLKDLTTAPPETVSNSLGLTDKPLRVGQQGYVSIYPDGLDVASVRWTTSPLPGAVLDPGGPTFDVNIRWTPTTPGTYPFGVEVTMNDGTVHTGAANVVAVPVPAPSLTLSNVTSTYETTYYPMNRVSFDITRAPGSDTTSSRVLESAEASADDTFQYSSGDVNGNRRLDDDEVWHYSGAVPWYDYEPGTSRVRTVVITANDTTGAQPFEDGRVAMTLTR